MSDTTTTESGATQATPDATHGAQGTSTPEGTPEGAHDDIGGPEGGNREAARYRTRLRETEAQRDALTGRLEAMQRAEVERQAGAELKNPAGLWSAGVQLGDLLTEDGTIDPEKVTAAALQAREDIGLASPMTRQNVAPKEGTTPESFGSRQSWEDVIAGHADGFDW